MIIIPPPPTQEALDFHLFGLRDTDPERGCEACHRVGRSGNQRTLVLHPYHGRQCPDHVTLPPGEYRPDLAENMAEIGRADAAFGYLRAFLAHRCDALFAGLAGRLAVREVEEMRAAERALWAATAAGWAWCVPAFLRVRGVLR